LRTSGGDKRCGSKQHCHFVEFVHGSPLEKSRRLAAIDKLYVLDDHHPKRFKHCATVICRYKPTIASV
jgi:hypothetical protein